MAVVGRVKFFKVPVYWLAQYLGAFVGAVCVYVVYRGLICFLILLIPTKRLCVCLFKTL